MKRAVTSTREILDDDAILRLAADRARPLFQVVERASALRPLVVVLAVLPGLVALEHRDVQSETAVWGLRAIDVLKAVTTGDFLNAGQSPETRPLSSQPPLATWLTAAVFGVIGTGRPPVAWIVSLLACAGAVWWTFRLFKSLEGTRVGFWGTLLLATHAGLLMAATSASPAILSMFLILILFDAWFRHSKGADGTVSIWLMLSGVAAGLVLLSGGPVILPAFVVLVLSEFCIRLVNHRMEIRNNLSTAQVAAGAGILIVTAFALGGWWLLHAHASIDGFWDKWWKGFDAAVVSATGGDFRTTVLETHVRDQLVHFLQIIGPLLPLSLTGLVFCFMDVGSNRDAHHRQKSVVLLCWTAVGLVGEYYSLAESYQQSLSDLFLLFPMMGLAAIGLEQILQRRMPFWLIFGLVLLSTALFPARLFLGDADMYFPGRHFGWYLTAVFSFFTLLWGIHIWTRNREVRRRRLMVGVVSAQILVAVLSGYFGLPPKSSETSSLMVVRDDLKRTDVLDSVTDVLLVSDRRDVSLSFAIRSILANAKWHETAPGEEFSPEKLAGLDRGTLVITWMESGKLNTTIGPQQLDPLTAPRFYRGRELRVFRLKRQEKDTRVSQN